MIILRWIKHELFGTTKVTNGAIVSDIHRETQRLDAAVEKLSEEVHLIETDRERFAEMLNSVLQAPEKDRLQ